jgi:hypothetical protein
METLRKPIGDQASKNRREPLLERNLENSLLRTASIADFDDLATEIGYRSGFQRPEKSGKSLVVKLFPGHFFRDKFRSLSGFPPISETKR